MSYSKLTVEFITNFVEYLDDDTFKNLLKFIYEKKSFKILPFKKYKEFFVYLILNDKIDVDFKTKNKLIINQSTHKIIFQYVEAIMLAVKAFFLENYPESSKFKKYLNYVVNKNIEDKCCYGIYKYDYNNQLYEIQKTILSPISSKHCTIVNEYYIEKLNNKLYIADSRGYCRVPFNNFVDLYNLERNIRNYKKLVHAVDKKIKELNIKLQKQKCCHICTPTRKSTAKDKKHMCENCNNLIEAICKNDAKNLNKQKIIYAIKKKDEDLKTGMNLNGIRQLRYYNLINYLIKLNTENKIKNKKEIEGLIYRVFNEFYGFHFS